MDPEPGGCLSFLFGATLAVAALIGIGILALTV